MAGLFRHRNSLIFLAIPHQVRDDGGKCIQVVNKITSLQSFSCVSTGIHIFIIYWFPEQSSRITRHPKSIVTLYQIRHGGLVPPSHQFGISCDPASSAGRRLIISIVVQLMVIGLQLQATLLMPVEVSVV